MKKTFKKLATNASKLDVELLHEYHPLKNDDSVYVEVEHLRNGDLINLTDIKERDIDFPKMFLKKVKAVHGVEIECADGSTREATKEDIVTLNDPDFIAIVVGTCSHLLQSMNLTEEEAKN